MLRVFDLLLVPENSIMGLKTWRFYDFLAFVMDKSEQVW